eukprot:4235420-Prymnesium_polylepis.2
MQPPTEVGLATCSSFATLVLGASAAAPEEGACGEDEDGWAASEPSMSAPLSSLRTAASGDGRGTKAFDVSDSKHASGAFSAPYCARRCRTASGELSYDCVAESPFTSALETTEDLKSSGITSRLENGSRPLRRTLMRPLGACCPRKDGLCVSHRRSRLNSSPRRRSRLNSSLSITTMRIGAAAAAAMRTNKPTEMGKPHASEEDSGGGSCGGGGVSGNGGGGVMGGGSDGEA